MSEAASSASAAVEVEAHAAADDEMPLAAGEPAAPDAEPQPLPATSAADDILGAIQRLKDTQSKLRAERKQVAKQLRNQQKRRTRLCKRARLLSDSDLLALLRMRSKGEAAEAEA